MVAREVVEKYGDKIMEHPVGTGPFKLDQWTRSSKITFVKNPNFREEYYEAEPPADDELSPGNLPTDEGQTHSCRGQGGNFHH